MAMGVAPWTDGESVDTVALVDAGTGTAANHRCRCGCGWKRRAVEMVGGGWRMIDR